MNDQLARAGSGSIASRQEQATRDATMLTSTMVARLSSPRFTRAFHVACISAASSTSRKMDQDIRYIDQ